MPKRIQLKRTKGWRMPPSTVKVDRTTKWGNPFRGPRAIRAFRQMMKFSNFGWISCNGKWVEKGDLPAQVNVLNYKRKIVVQNVTLVQMPNCLRLLLTGIEDLRGKDLACWCKPGEPCHADVLLELANA